MSLIVWFLATHKSLLHFTRNDLNFILTEGDVMYGNIQRNGNVKVSRQNRISRIDLSITVGGEKNSKNFLLFLFRQQSLGEILCYPVSVMLKDLISCLVLL